MYKTRTQSLAIGHSTAAARPVRQRLAFVPVTRKPLWVRFLELVGVL